MGVHGDLRAGTVKELQADSSYMALVGGRVYPRSMAELSVDSDGVDVTNVTFPVTTFRIVASGRPNKYIFTPQMLVQHWSEDDYDEAWEIAEAFRSVVDNVRIVVGDSVFCWEVTNAGQEVFDPDHQLYYVVQQYKSTLLGT